MDASEFATAQGASIDKLLNLLYVLLLFSVVIAVLGIVNTLALSVLERTREIGCCARSAAATTAWR